MVKNIKKISESFLSLLSASMLSTLLLYPLTTNSATYYVDVTAANDSGNGSVTAPKKTINAGVGLMSIAGGDTLIVRAGIYSGAQNELTVIRNGVAENYNTIKAEVDGSVIVTANLNLATSSAYVRFEGIRWESPLSKSIKGHHLKFLRCAFAGGPPIDNTTTLSIGTNDTTPGAQYILLEDVWAYGPGGRYNIIVYNSDKIILRRVIARHDGGWSDTKGDPEAGITIYNSSDTYVQNGMVIDSNLVYNNWEKAFYNVKNGSSANPHRNTKLIGSISLNNVGYGVGYDDGGPIENARIEHSVIWGNGGGLAIGGGSAAGHTIFAQNVTVGGSSNGHAFANWGTGSTLEVTNSIAYGNSGNAFGGSNTVTHSFNNCHANGANCAGAGETNINPLANGWLYLPRIETASTLKTAGTGGAQMGAELVKRIGVSETLFGEPGYDTVTNENLWPWPNQQRIQSEMCNDAGVTRGFCSASNLSQYIWAYLGNACPADVCGAGTSDTQAPTTPTSLVANAVSASRIDLNWNAATDNVGVNGYRIFRNGIAVGTTASTAYNDSGLGASTTYSYAVAAYDAATNVSSVSGPVSATTFAASLICSQATVRCVDDTAGATQEYANIQLAANAALPGDTLLIHDGSYTGFQIAASGTASQPIVIRALGSNAVINANGTTNDGVRLQNVSYVTVEGLTIQNISDRCIAARGATATQPMRGLVIRNNTCTNAGREGFYLSQVADSLVEGNRITGSGVSGAARSHGIYLANGGADNTILRGNIISGSTPSESNGIHMNGDLSVGGDGIISGLTIENNIIFNNAQNGLNMDGVQSSLVQNNLLYSNARHALRAYAIDGAQGPVNLRIINNTMHTPATGGWAVKLSEDLGGHTLFNNILISDNSATGSISVGNSSLMSNNNIAVNRFSINNEATIISLTQWQQGGYDANSFLSTPGALFLNVPDYHLSNTSPARDAGRASLNGTNAPSTDLANDPRPSGITYDVGAYEFAAPPPPPGTLAFTAAAYTIAENGGSVLMSVSRSGGSAGVASVSFASANGTATSGSDYTLVSGNLTWANGEGGTKTFSIPIQEDSVVESTESFTVSLSNASGASLGSPASATITITDNDVGNAPTGLSATVISSGRISVSWNSGMPAYQLERCSGSPATCTLFSLSGTSFTDQALSPLTTYTYRVRGIDSNGVSGNYANPVSATTGAAPANPPPVVSLTTNGTTFSPPANVTLTATASDDGSINQVEFFLGNTLIASDSSAPYSLTWSGLLAGSYVFRARAIDNLGSIANSNSVTVTVTVGSDTTAPSVPGGLTATVLSSSQIALAWGAASDASSPLSYELERCTTGPVAVCTVFILGNLSFTDRMLLALTSYGYRVRAIDRVGNRGGWSPLVTATTTS